MKSLLVLRIRYAVAIDIACIIAAYVASIIIRFEPSNGAWPILAENQALLWLSLLMRLPIYVSFGLYRRLWRYASTRDMVAILFAGTVSFLVIYAVNFYVLRPLGLPHCASRSVLVLDWLLNLGLLSSTRLALRLAQERMRLRERRLLGMFITNPRQVLVAGAGDAGAIMVREMRHRPELGMNPIGFVDDDAAKIGLRVHDAPVLGAIRDIPALAKVRQIDEVIIAMPSAPGTVIRNIKRLCHESGIQFRTIPSLYELLDGKVSVAQLREVRIEDLLRRDPVVTDQAGVRACIRGTCVLVTGAGGSIGSELCRQVARHGATRLILLGHGEFSIFNIERELRRRFPHVPVEPVIADVRDAERISRIVERFRPTTIFHAAAHKHVPLMETNVEEAFTNNVLGTRSVLRAAEEHSIERFVMISTDKAVNPTSVMGATKRVAELLVQQTAARTRRPYVAVRFGNVLGSRGSAVPIFQEQIASGGPVTVTHPDMRRFFMTIPEAVQLVLQAAVLGQGGEVFMLDMGEPVRIVDLVNDLIELSGLAPGEDIEVVFTGMRPGEKLYEELFLDSEHYGATLHEKIFVCRNGQPALGSDSLERRIEAIAALARRTKREAVVEGLREVVPEFEAGSLVAPL